MSQSRRRWKSEVISAPGGGIFSQARPPETMREEKKEKGPAELDGEAGGPSGRGESSAKGGGGEPVLVGKGEALGEVEKSGRKQIEGKDVAPGEEFKRVDEKDEGADIKNPKRGEGKTKGQAELQEGGAKDGGKAASKIDRAEFERNNTGEEEETEGDGDESGGEVGATTGEKESAPIEAVGEGAQKDGVEGALPNLAGDLEIIVGG